MTAKFSEGDRVMYIPHPGAKPEWGTVERIDTYAMVRWDECGTIKSVTPDRIEHADKVPEQ